MHFNKKKVYAQLPDGTTVWAESLAKAARICGVKYQSLSDAAAHGYRSGGWKWRYSPIEGAVPLTKEIAGRSFKKRGHRTNQPLWALTSDGYACSFPSQAVAASFLGVGQSSVSLALTNHVPLCGSHVTDHKPTGFIEVSPEEMPFRRRARKQISFREEKSRPEPGILTGHYNPYFGPLVCPICHMVVGGFRTKQEKHLERCLAGRPYRTIGLGIIEVYDVKPTNQ